MSEAVAVPRAASSGGSRWRKIFFGPHGLRAGWSFLIFVAITQALGAALFFVVKLRFEAFVFPRGRHVESGEPLSLLLVRLRSGRAGLRRR